MVKVKQVSALLPDGTIDVTQWLQRISQKGSIQNMEKIRAACTLSQLSGQDHATETGESCLQQGLAMADVLLDLEVDEDTLAAAIIFESVNYAELSLDDVEEQLSVPIARLVKGVKKMSAISSFQLPDKFRHNKHQLDNVRKMLLAMVDDVRVVLIKLAERLCVLRSSVPLSDAMRRQIATEAMDIYAPLANRLGIGAIKWEMEDLAFRYLHPLEYKTIASELKSKRIERDRYVDAIVDTLNQKLNDLGMQHFAVYGRSKHIHSIYRKMVRKNVSLQQIYDATAVRILLETEAQCYEVLGLVHALWEQVVAEFDDYISRPKSNGYQSLHTAVLGPENRVFEVQIRTFQMHEQAEMGVAAHWKYKEGGAVKRQAHERRIEWLRQVLAWHRDMATNRGMTEAVAMEFLDDRVYVFTPEGDVLDLPHGVTPLDFAYHVHSQMGHRCRGAKVNGYIVPLTYSLKTGDKIEILTSKELKPSRDWLNPHLGYLKTSRAKAKVLHWFKMQDYDKNKQAGQEILDNELKILGIKSDALQQVYPELGFKNLDDLRAALGRGDIKLTQITHRLIPTGINQITPRAIKPVSQSDLHIEGVGRLLTHMARCCQPLPGEHVIGYITIGRGVSIHRQDCPHIINCSERQKQRFIQVSWTDAMSERYTVDLFIRAYDRPGLLRDITTLLANEKTNVMALQTNINKQENMTNIMLTIEMIGLGGLSRILARIGEIPNVLEARRQI
jgi:GTP pyrophosphokinase